MHSGRKGSIDMSASPMMTAAQRSTFVEGQKTRAKSFIPQSTKCPHPEDTLALAEVLSPDELHPIRAVFVHCTLCNTHLHGTWTFVEPSTGVPRPPRWRIPDSVHDEEWFHSSDGFSSIDPRADALRKRPRVPLVWDDCEIICPPKVRISDD
eukprot:TRINITY_DN16767_c0_g1_i1.p1 TRINITY_DN16767_c0_g1~~TRINITY_DN16767_c0_g1_i1.p1  ORF type:complete len:152 (+),score=1.10 TRINITY_DN16767_c0_g1_i1:100-555(+)